MPPGWGRDPEGAWRKLGPATVIFSARLVGKEAAYTQQASNSGLAPAGRHRTGMVLEITWYPETSRGNKRPEVGTCGADP